MRTRLLRPGFFENEELAALPPHARLLFAGLWLMADRAGRLKDRPPVIRATLFPYEAAVDIEPLLDELALGGFITRYVAHGVKCIEVVHFATHQSPHPHEIPSKLPHAQKSHGSAVTSHGAAHLVLDLDPDTCKPAAPAFSLPPGKVYRAIAYQAIDEEPTDDLGAIAERFKTICAKKNLPYDSRITQKAIDQALRVRARRQA